MLNHRYVKYVVLAGCIVVAGCVNQTRSESALARQARGLKGQNIKVALAAYGPPKFVDKIRSSMNPKATAVYNWADMRVSKSLEFVQTGSQYTGSQVVGMSQGGNGVASMPIYQNNYAPTGYYQHSTEGCFMQLTTDAQGIILDSVVTGALCQ